MRSELIFTTYNWPEALWLVLVAASVQDRQVDSICIADDGSGPETRAMIDQAKSAFPKLSIRHLWHEDKGFRKTEILNKAIASSGADYIIFIDGDCLMSPGFIARHLDLARPGQYCCGSMIRLPQAASDLVNENLVRDGTVFDRKWLSERGALGGLTTWLKAAPLPRPILSWLERTSPVRRTFCGANASAFRVDLLNINGFDETMRYGGLDKELGVRLANSGIKGRHLRFSAPLVHLNHGRPYRDPEQVRHQRSMIRTARENRKTWTEHGIRKPV